MTPKGGGTFVPPTIYLKRFPIAVINVASAMTTSIISLTSFSVDSLFFFLLIATTFFHCLYYIMLKSWTNAPKSLKKKQNGCKRPWTMCRTL